MNSSLVSLFDRSLSTFGLAASLLFCIVASLAGVMPLDNLPTHSCKSSGSCALLCRCPQTPPWTGLVFSYWNYSPLKSGTVTSSPRLIPCTECTDHWDGSKEAWRSTARIRHKTVLSAPVLPPVQCRLKNCCWCPSSSAGCTVWVWIWNMQWRQDYNARVRTMKINFERVRER